MTIAPLQNPAGPTPALRPLSIRRTASISTIWPEGPDGPMLMTGQARDLLTPEAGMPRVIATGWFEILASMRREILRIAAWPDLPVLQGFTGQRGGAKFRTVLAAVLPEQKAAGTPLYALLDDFPGASLVAPWAWSRWNPGWAEAARTGALANAGRSGQMEGICIGFAPGASGLLPDGGANHLIQSATPVEEIGRPGDTLAWHEMISQSGTASRRLRRTDVWLDGDAIHIDIHFQDSATTPEGGRAAVHEYLLSAVADRNTQALRSLTPDPRILPYQECPGAVAHAQKLLGQPLAALREAVPATLPGILGCTHLNDVLRSLADVPLLAALLED